MATVNIAYNNLNMLLLAHIIIALTSVVVSTYTVFRPALKSLRVSSALVGATLASGTYLVISTHAPMLSSCVTGLVYTGLVLSLILSANFRLDKIRIRSID